MKPDLTSPVFTDRSPDIQKLHLDAFSGKIANKSEFIERFIAAKRKPGAKSKKWYKGHLIPRNRRSVKYAFAEAERLEKKFGYFWGTNILE